MAHRQAAIALTAACFNAEMDLEWLFARCIPEPNSGCWLWTMSLKGGTAMTGGYAQTSYRQQRSVAAHILAYRFKHGPVPPGLVLDHKCRVTCCINPDHLEPVPQAENVRRGLSPAMARGMQKGFAALKRAQTKCKRGHEFTPENTHIGKSGSRFCLQCRKDARAHA